MKHSNVFPRLASPYFSPLYRLAPVEVSELSKEDRILAEVSEFVKLDEDRGHALYNAISSDNGMEEAELRQFIETWGE